MARSIPDPPGTDDDLLTQSEALDEDDMGVDPLEDGMDPADGWSAADRYGTTAIEQATDRPLTERLAEERPDVSTLPMPDRPVAATPVDELDESVDDEDDEVVPGEPTSREEQVLVGDVIDNTGESATPRSSPPPGVACALVGNRRGDRPPEAEMTADQRTRLRREGSSMADITQLILDDHETFRREFAALDDASGLEQLRAVWEPLAALLDVHAVAEETIFYPQLLRRGDDAEAETVDAIGDHNDIRDGIHEAARHPIGSPQWWEAVHKARAANSEHMAEEEDDALPDFRRNAPLRVREELGRQFLEFKADHAGARDLDTSDKDPQDYVSAVQEQISSSGANTSLGIGSLKRH